MRIDVMIDCVAEPVEPADCCRRLCYTPAPVVIAPVVKAPAVIAPVLPKAPVLPAAVLPPAVLPAPGGRRSPARAPGGRRRARTGSCEGAAGPGRSDRWCAACRIDRHAAAAAGRSRDRRAEARGGEAQG